MSFKDWINCAGWCRCVGRICYFMGFPFHTPFGDAVIFLTMYRNRLVFKELKSVWRKARENCTWDGDVKKESNYLFLKQTKNLPTGVAITKKNESANSTRFWDISVTCWEESACAKSNPNICVYIRNKLFLTHQQCYRGQFVRWSGLKQQSLKRQMKML